MLKPQIESALRGVTQGEATSSGVGGLAPSTSRPRPEPSVVGRVRIVTNLNELEGQLASASKSCAVIFFTSATCPPCKILYPTYDELAEEAGDKAILIKCDVSSAYDISMKYGIRATPTFMSFLKGEKLEEWSGADRAKLQGNVRLLIQMAHPPHPHQQLRLPTLQRKIPRYVTYKNMPPLDKLVPKLGNIGNDPRLTTMLDFIKKTGSRCSSGSTNANGNVNAAEAALPTDPGLREFSQYVRSTMSQDHLSDDSRFALVDLVRVLFIDPRVGGYFAESEQSNNHEMLLMLLGNADNEAVTPAYKLRLVRLQLACNLFTSPLSAEQAVSHSTLRETCTQLITSNILDTEHSTLRVVAAALAFNIAVYNHNHGRQGTSTPDALPEETQVELTASLTEAIWREESSAETLHAAVFALGLLVYEAPMDGAVVDLCSAMDAVGAVNAKTKVSDFKGERELLREVGQLLS